MLRDRFPSAIEIVRESRDGHDDHADRNNLRLWEPEKHLGIGADEFHEKAGNAGKEQIGEKHRSAAEFVFAQFEQKPCREYRE